MKNTYKTKTVKKLHTNELTMLYFISKQNNLDLCIVRQCDVAIAILKKSITQN